MQQGDESRPIEDGVFKRDVAYFRDTQYVTSDNLDVRVGLHEKYSTARQDWFEWLAEQIDWSSARDVLEVGCGTGLFWTHVSPSVGQHLVITLSDLSQAMVDTALARAQECNRDAKGLAADVHGLPFDDDSFDLVIANHMLYHSPDPSSAIKEIARVLRPGGTLIASTNGPRHLHELYDIDAAVFGATSARNDNVMIFGSVSGVSLLRQSFGEIDWRSHEDRLVCTEPDDVVAYLTSAPPGEGASPSELAELHSEVRRRMNDGSGVLMVSKDAGVFMAHKSSI